MAPVLITGDPISLPNRRLGPQVQHRILGDKVEHGTDGDWPPVKGCAGAVALFCWFV